MLKTIFKSTRFMSFRFLFFICLSMIIVSSCANYKLNYHKTAAAWEDEKPAPSLRIEHSMYLIGDAGNAPEGKSNPTLKYLEKKLKTASENSQVLFLGDNIYPAGLPPEGSPSRKRAQHRIDVQLDILKDYKGQPIFIPGNHDWIYDGLDAVRRQEAYVETYLNRGNTFLPDNGCGGPKVIEINDKLVLVIIDSQWWLTPWNREKEINDDCAAKSRKVFATLFEDAVKKHRNKNVVIALHHPLFSNGPHGGYYTVKQHLFPLTDLNDNLYIPLPGLGTLAAFIRSTVGTRQDLAYAKYRELKRKLLASAKKNGNFIFVSGHEHNLQYFETEDQYFVVSGAGSKSNPAKTGNGALFAYGGNGFSKLDFYEDGTVWVSFWQPNETGDDGTLIYRKKVKGTLKSVASPAPTSFPEYEAKMDSIEVAITDEDMDRSKFFEWVWGKHYRALYPLKIKVPVLDLSTYRGGVIPLQRGGGYQTNSLRLGSSDGKQFAMRSMSKDATRIVPYPFNETFAIEIMKDQFTAAHPMAAFAIPPMAEAIGMYHTNPVLYYVPKQPALGSYNDLFGGGLYLVEERPSGNWEEADFFGNSKKIISTPKVIKKITKNHNHKVDQKAVVRARLFDISIGDWDRHDDQWRWASIEQEEGRKLYRPIPRDRDQPFSKYDGLITSMTRRTIPFLKQLKVYEKDTKNVEWINYHARYFDRSFLNEPSWEDWEKEVKLIQNQLTDAVIESAVRSWPDTVYQLTGPEIIEKLKARRDKLHKLARHYYKFLARKVEVVGTEKRDLFEVKRLNDQETRVIVHKLSKKGKKKRKIYERVFRTDETKEISLYGLGDDDEFNITGEVNKGILVRVIGGLGEDQFTDHSKVKGPSKKTRIYDTRKGNKLDVGKEVRNCTSDKRRRYNMYNRKAYHHEFDYALPFPYLGGNPDDGFFLGANMTFFKYGFKKEPYAQKHQIGIRYAFITEAYDLEYTGDFTSAIGRWDLLINARLQGPQYVVNYFGFGNETEKTASNRNYNRVRQQLYGFYPAIKRRFTDNSFFSFGPLIESIKIEETRNRFISDQTAGTSDAIFSDQAYGGARFEFDYSNTDKPQIPSRGVKFNTRIHWKANLEETDKNFTGIGASFTAYQSLASKGSVVLATRVGTEHVEGDAGDFEFFQAATLGDHSNLRGYRNQRFTGQTSFYHNTDLRLRLFRVKSYYFPFVLGISGGFDYGRVWVENENSDKWHHSVGGGLWLTPFDAMVIAANLFHSEEQNRFTFGLGFFF